MQNLNQEGPGSLTDTMLQANDGDTVTFLPELKGELHAGVAFQKNVTLLGTPDVFLKESSASVTAKVSAKLVNVIFIGTASRRTLIIVTNGVLTVLGSRFTQSSIVLENQSSVVVDRSIFTYSDPFVMRDSDLLVTNSTFTRNILVIEQIGHAHAVVMNSTFDLNDIIIGGSGTLQIIQSTIRGKSIEDIQFGRAQITLKNSILAVMPFASDHTEGCLQTLIDGGGNVMFPSLPKCSTTVPVGDPKLGPLQDNGGGIPTMALLPGSAAIGAGNPETCNLPELQGKDQRGFTWAKKGSNSACDAGAFQTKVLAATPTP